MFSTLIFIGVVLVLALEGLLLALLALGEPVEAKYFAPTGSRNRALILSLSLPLSTFANLLIIFAYTIANVPLDLISFTSGHLLVIIVSLILKKKRNLDPPGPSGTAGPLTLIRWPLTLACSLILSSTLVYSFSHAILLPSFQYDSATNWTMRSQVSWADTAMAFDHDESRGMAKPQYPYLFHALQVTANVGQAEWSDTYANAILYLLSISTFAALFLLIKRLRGVTHSLLTITLVLSIPLVAVHLAQGYGDINLLQYLLLSLTCLAVFMESDRKNMGWLLLSALFTAASVWTKSEGLFFGLLPWTLLLVMIAWKHHRPMSLINPAVLAWIPSISWLYFAWSHGLGLTPHTTDTQFGFHPEGLAELWPAMFSRGSFGITWYVLPVAMVILAILLSRKDRRADCRQLLALLWGIIIFIEVLAIYLFTPNVRFLLNAEAFYRQMAVPAAMMILACSLIYVPSNKTRPSRSGV